MIDWFVLIAPLLLLPIVLLCAFVGCAVGVSDPSREFTLRYRRGDLDVTAVRFDITVDDAITLDDPPDRPGPRIGPDVVDLTQTGPPSPPTGALGRYTATYRRFFTTTSGNGDTEFTLRVTDPRDWVPRGIWTVRCRATGLSSTGAGVSVDGTDVFTVRGSERGRVSADFIIVPGASGFRIVSAP